MKQSLRDSRAGYTLIELLLYMAIASIILTSVTALFAMVSSAQIKSQTVSEVNAQGQFALEYMTQTIRNATSVTIPTAGVSTAGATLVVPTVSNSPTIFSISGGVLYVKQGTAATVALTSSSVSVSNLSITNLSRGSTRGVARISLTLNRASPSGLNEYNYQQTFTSSAALR